MPSSPSTAPMGAAGPSTVNDYSAASETTPLLAEADASPIGGADVSRAATVDEQADGAGDEGNVDDKPLPMRQVAVLCFARWVEPVAFFSIFPYVNKMAQEIGNLPDADVGFYSGLIESLFSLTQMALMILWGKTADRRGRKPVLVFSLIGVTLATGLFGMARTIWQMILFRCLAGVFAATIVTVRTMLSEHSTSKTQARAFSWFAFAGNLGIFFGPLLGGALAEPAKQYPSLFGGIPFFSDYPYALPSLAVSAIGVAAVITTILFAEETLVKEGDADTEEATSPARPVPLTSWGILKSPGVALVICAYGHLSLLAYSYTAICPVFWFTPVPLGGFGFTPFQISLFLGLAGLSQAIWILLVFPPLQHRIGTSGILRICASFYPFFFALCPVLNLLLRNGFSLTFWIAAPTLLSLGSGVSMSFTAIQLALNDVSPSPAVLGTLNAMAFFLSTGVRAFSPALFSSLFAVGARTQWLWGHAIWVLMCALAFGFLVITRYMPDYDELRKQRERMNAARKRWEIPHTHTRAHTYPDEAPVITPRFSEPLIEVNGAG